MITDYPRFMIDLASFGVKLDPAVAEAMAVIEEARDVRNARPLEDLASKYARGEVTSRNTREQIIEAATLAAGSERIHLAAAQIENAACGTLRAWVKKNSDQIVDQLRLAFDQRAAHVAVAAHYFPPDATPAQLVAAGAAAVEAHEGLDATLSTLNTLRSLRVEVADCAGFGADEQDATWWIAGARDAASLEHARRLFHGVGNAFHALAHAGFTLRMNTTAEAAKVAAGARAITDAREAAEREAAAAEVRESWRGIIPIAG